MNFGVGLWRLADPKVSLASFASLFLGLAAASAHVPLAWGWLVLTVAGIFAVEVAKNASGEVFDFDSGVDQAVSNEDRSPFSGGKRVLVDSLLSRGQTWAIALGGYSLAIVIGLLICVMLEPRVLTIGIAGTALAFFYHAPPLRLAYRGFGELAVGIVYGPLIALGAFLVQTGRTDTTLAWLSLSLGLLIAAFLLINEFPDYRADRAGSKRNLVVRLGRARRSPGAATWPCRRSAPRGIPAPAAVANPRPADRRPAHAAPPCRCRDTDGASRGVFRNDRIRIVTQHGAR